MAGSRICTTHAQGFTILFSTGFCTDLYLFTQKSLIFKPLPQEEIQFPLSAFHFRERELHFTER